MISPKAWKLLYVSALLTDMSFATDSIHSSSTRVRLNSPSSTTASSDGNIPVPTGKWLSPVYKWFFQYPLPLANIKSPKLTYHPDNAQQAIIDYYEIEVKKFTKQIYPNLAATELVGYDGESPGPLFMMQQGREAVVRFTNNGPWNMSVHVHGQYNRAPFDGWAGDFATPGQYKDYYYPNGQNARTIWYHDHTEYTTGEHAYWGQEGFYLIRDTEEQSLSLPSGDYDVAMALMSKVYNADGSLNYDTNNNAGLWGDIIHVNGQPWPYFQVEPRKYRIRLLNGATSRTFSLSLAIDNKSNGQSSRRSDYIVGTTKDVDFDVIASDGGLFSYPVNTNSLAMSMGERYEIVVDFTDYANKNLTMRNDQGMGENVDYAATDMVMRFVVGGTVKDNCNNGAIPSTLRSIPSFPDKDSPDKHFTFARENDTWLINGVGFSDVENRILTRPLRGADEIWTMTNGGGNGTHPVHIHLVDFQVLSRKGGRNQVLPYEGAGMKDVVWLAGGETVKVGARYAPWDGVYMFHCHNLVHEDHDMLVAFNVTDLAKWGYDNSTIFIDPLQPEFRPKDYNPADYTSDAIMKKLAWFWSTNAYNHGNEAGVYSALDAYATGTPASTLQTVASVSSSSVSVASSSHSPTTHAPSSAGPRDSKAWNPSFCKG